MNSFSIIISDQNTEGLSFPNTLESFNKYIPRNNHVIWDHKMIVSFIKDNFNSDVLDAYNSLNAYAYKADLASYCILSKIGGWYSAITNEMVSVVPDTSDNSLVIFRDIQKYSNTSWAVACQLIYSQKNNPVFDIAINRIVENVKNKHYGNNPLCVTGPVVLGQAVAQVGDINYYSIGDFEESSPRVFRLSDGTVLARYKQLNYGDIGIQGTNNYNTIWNDKNVYGEKHRYDLSHLENE